MNYSTALPSVLLLLLGLSACAPDAPTTPRPEPPPKLKYAFHHGAVVPQLPGSRCTPTYIASMLEYLDHRRDENLTAYAIDDRHVTEVVVSLDQQVARAFEFVEDQRTETIREIYARMTDSLPARLQGHEIHLVHHRSMGEDYVNAMYYPGHVLITTGIYQLCRNRDELAMIIGHELGHGAMGHFYEAFQEHARWKQRLRSVGVDPQGRVPVITTYLERLITSGQGQADELAADCSGAFFTAAAGYDPRKGAVLWDAMEELHHHERTWIDETWGSHPAPRDRKACLDHDIDLAEEHARAINSIREAAYRGELRRWEADNGKRSSRKRMKRVAGAGLILIGALAMLGIYRLTSSPYARYATYLIAACGICIGVLPLLAKRPTPPLPPHCDEDRADDRVFTRSDAVINVHGLNVRQCASLEAPVKDVLARTDTVYCHYCSTRDDINGRSGRWCFVETRSQVSGYAWGHNLRLVTAK